MKRKGKKRKGDMKEKGVMDAEWGVGSKRAEEKEI